MNNLDHTVVDVHVHVGVVGDSQPQHGGMSKHYRESVGFKIFLLFLGVNEDDVCDDFLREETIKRISVSKVDKVVLLALDPVYDKDGNRQESRSHMWVANEYVYELCHEPRLANRALMACSVHPYDRNFKERVREWIGKGAVVIKWLPSAQQIDLASDRVREALLFLAKACPDNTPLPLLLHVGPEYAIPSTDERTRTYDYLTWSTWDDVVNFFRFKKKWHKPNIKALHKNLKAGLEAGAQIIFAHCGLPYFFSGFMGQALEHDEFRVVRRYLLDTKSGKFAGKCYTDVSAIATPFRRNYFKDVAALPEDLVLYGSDFPTPVFELSADLKEMMADFEAMLKGDLGRIIIPQDNLLDVNLRELRNFFPNHPLFHNFARQLL